MLKFLKRKPKSYFVPERGCLNCEHVFVVWLIRAGVDDAAGWGDPGRPTLRRTMESLP